MTFVSGTGWLVEPEQAACGHWVERDEREGFCHLPPLHEGRCEPPEYEGVTQ